MATYRMTPARRAALEKAQAASARKRRKGGNRSRRSRLVNRHTVALAAVGGIATYAVVSNKLEEREFLADPLNQIIIDRHTELAKQQNARLNQLKALGFPPQAPRIFDSEAARREAIEILRRRKRRKS